MPGALAALQRLQAAGLALGVVTSGERERVSRELAISGRGRFFGPWSAAGDTAQRKPHPEPLLLALERLGLAAGEAAYVGDSPEDVEMARAAGVYAVGIPGGFPEPRGRAGGLGSRPAGPRSRRGRRRAPGLTLAQAAPGIGRLGVPREAATTMERP